MNRIAVCFLLVFGLSLGMVGCAEKTEVKKVDKVTTPTGTDTKTTTIEEKKTGDMKDAPANP